MSNSSKSSTNKNNPKVKKKLGRQEVTRIICGVLVGVMLLSTAATALIYLMI